MMAATYREILKACEKELTEAGVPGADWDAWLLLSHCFGLDQSSYLLRRDQKQELPKEKLEELQRLTQERRKRIPLQYLLGTQEFMGLSFLVNESVLIPRADTETLVEAVLEDCRKACGREMSEAAKEMSVLDVCTGSGCIAIALACLGGFGCVDAADLSEEALCTAECNAARNGASVRFFHGDLFGGISKSYDVIVSNPPYIEDSVIEGLEPEVRDYEPRMALSGGADGLDFYRRLAREAGAYLKPGGRIYLEIGYNQSEWVAGLLRNHGFTEIRVRKDLAGKDRVVSACYGTKGRRERQR